MIPTKKYNPTKRSGHTFDLQHINDTECFRLDDRVLDAFFLGLPGRCRRKTRCSAFNFDALCQRINEATHKKKTCCCNLPKQPLLELLAEAKSLRFWCLLLGLRLLALPPTTDSTKMCLSHVFQMLATKIIPEKKKKHVPQPWALAFSLNGISAPSWHLNRTQVFIEQMLCFTILEKQRNVGTNTWPKRHRFHGSPNDFCSYYLAIYPFKSVTKQQQGGGNIDEK